MNAFKGSTGTQMGGKTVRVKPRRYEWNDEYCNVCLADTGRPCTKRDWEGKKSGKWVTYREETHKTTAVKRGLTWPMTYGEAESVRLRMQPKNGARSAATNVT